MGAVVEYIDPGGGGFDGVRIFEKVVTQVVLFCGAETWVITPRMEQALSSFQHRVARWMTGGQPRIQGGGSWD